MPSNSSSRWRLLSSELAHHFPYTVVGTFIAMAAVWWFATQHVGLSSPGLTEDAEHLFHLFHPLHLLLSAIATTSLFWRHDPRLVRAVAVGVLGTIIPCGMSDYLFPYIGGVLLGQPMHLHLCITEHPQLVWSFVGLGIVAGIWAEDRLASSHLFSHGAHVFVSGSASLLYLVSFGFTSWMTDVRYLFPAFVIIVLAVWIPCCISDIVVPITTANGLSAHPHTHGHRCADHGK